MLTMIWVSSITQPLLFFLLLLPTTSAEPQLWSRSLAPSLAKRPSGYNPISDLCGSGTDCSSTCGKIYQTCDSSDGLLHCFNPAQKQICCPNGSGYSCDDGYYCSQDGKGKTYCCPNEMNLATCAGLFGASTLVTAHSTTTLTLTLAPTPQSISTTTDISTEIVTLINGTIAGQTQTVLSTTTSKVFGNLTASIRPTSGPNSTIVLYTPGNARHKISLRWECFVVAGLGVVALSI